MKPIILLPENNILMIRNNFIIEIFTNENNHISTHYQISKDTNNFNDENLVFNLIETNVDKLKRTNVHPSYLTKDSYYGIRVKVNDNEWSDTTVIKVKAESGWETILTYDNLDIKKEKIGFVSNGMNEELFCISNIHSFKYNLNTYEKNIITNPNNINIDNSFFIGSNNFIYGVNIDSGLIIERYNNLFNAWELFYIDHNNNYESDIGYFTNGNKIVLVMKDKNRINPSELTFHILTNETYSSFKYFNEKYNKDTYILNSLVYFHYEYNYEVIGMNCKIPKSLDSEDINVTEVFLKFKLKENTLEIYEAEIEDFIEVGNNYYNGIYIPSMNRIYWNNKYIKESSTIAWDNRTLKKCKVIPYGGELHIRNQFDNSLYAVGAKSRKDGICYLKKYIE